LEAAAKEFVAHGFEAASLNRILDDAGISKGAAYYYFDDKTDLYATTTLHYSGAYSDENVHEFRGCRPLSPQQRDHRFRLPGKTGRHVSEQVVGIARNGWTASIGIDGRHGPDYAQELLGNSLYDPARFTAQNYWDEIAALYRRQFTSYAERPWVFGLAKAGGSLSAEMLAQGPLADLWEQAQFLLVQLLQHGRELGLIRNDLPEELLLSLVIAVDDAHDRWLFAHWSELSPADLEKAATRIADKLRRLLTPELI
jgi:AcrR family transcriptional regulator